MHQIVKTGIGEGLKPLLLKKVSFFMKKCQTNTERCSKLLEYALLVLSIKLFEFHFQNEFFKYLNKSAHEIGRKSSNNPAKLKSSNQSKICSKIF